MGRGSAIVYVFYSIHRTREPRLGYYVVKTGCAKRKKQDDKQAEQPTIKT